MKQLSLTDVRAKLSPTLKRIDRGPVAIKVRGRVAAYLVSKDDFEALIEKNKHRARPFDVADSMQIVGDIEGSFASDETIKAAVASWDKSSS